MTIGMLIVLISIVVVTSCVAILLSTIMATLLITNCKLKEAVHATNLQRKSLLHRKQFNSMLNAKFEVQINYEIQTILALACEDPENLSLQYKIRYSQVESVITVINDILDNYIIMSDKDIETYPLNQNAENYITSLILDAPTWVILSAQKNNNNILDYTLTEYNESLINNMIFMIAKSLAKDIISEIQINGDESF